MTEAELYPPIKRFLEEQGYQVKGEIGACDLVAVRGDEGPVVVELKQQLNLALLLQAVDRLRLSPTVYVAFATGPGRSAAWRRRRRSVRALLRRLGLGLLTVSPEGRVEAVLDPAPYRPRIDRRRRGRLLREFAERVGDPETGGSSIARRFTAYRQDAVRCARELSGGDPLKASVVRDRSGVPRAGDILRANHYGWFERVTVGHYELTPRGERELVEWLAALEAVEGSRE